MIELNRIEAAVLAVVSLLAGAAVATPVALWYGGSHATAIGDAKLARYEAQVSAERAQAARNAGEILAEETARGNRLTGQLLAAQDQIDTLSLQLKSSVPHVTTVYREAPGAPLKPLPVCVLTRGWLRAYNAAIGAVVPDAPQGPGGTAQASTASATAAGEDDLLPADIDPADILTHHIDYGARVRKLEQQLDHLIDFEEGVDAQ